MRGRRACTGQIILISLVCLVPMACTVGIVRQEVLTPGASVLSTPEVLPTSTALPTPVSDLLPAYAQNVEFVGHVGGSTYAVAAQGNYVYIGEGYSLTILDTSNPALPIVVSGTSLLPDIIQDVYVAEDYAYAADQDGGLWIVDISDPVNPMEVGFYRTPGAANGVAVAGNYAYVAAECLVVIDISSPANPTQVGTHDTPLGAYDVAVGEDHAYVATWGGLHIVDVSDPASPTLVGGYKTPRLAKDIAVVGNYVYVAIVNGLRILDVSNPTNPIEVGFYDTPTSAEGVAIAGNHAYVADHDGGLWIVDISAPAHPVEMGSYDMSEYVGGLAAAGDYAYVAIEHGGLRVVDVSAPNNPVEVGLYDTLGSASSVAVVGDYAYVADGKLWIVDVSNPANPLVVGSCGMPGFAEGVAVVGNYAYVANHENGYGSGSGLGIVDVSVPTDPARVSFYDMSNTGWVAVSRRYAYADTWDGLRVLDISTPSEVEEVGRYYGPGGEGVHDLVIDGSYAYAATGGLRVLDVSNPVSLTEVGLYDMPRESLRLASEEDYVYVVDWDGLRVVDVSTPEVPTEVGVYNTPGQPYDVAVAGDYVYIAAEDRGLRVVDVSNPTRPTGMGFYDTRGEARGVAVAGDYVYVADVYGGLLVLRVVPPVGAPRPPTAQAPPLQGEWHRITAADGLCTDWPRVIGEWYIGTHTTTVCGSTEPLHKSTWPTMTIPLGTRVTSVAQFPPGGEMEFATDAGVCRRTVWGEGWECMTPDSGFPYEDVRQVVALGTEPVYMLADAVAYKGQMYNIPEIAGAGNAYPTWIAVSGKYGPTPKIWAGTNGYGIIVIYPERGTTTHYTTFDGLPGNVIRDVNTGAENDRSPDLQDVWVATNNGVAHWDGEYWTAYTTTDGLPSNDVRGVASSRVNTVWAATAGGVAYFNGHTWQVFTHENGLPEGDLNGVAIQAWSNEVWFGTRGSGLLVFTLEATQ